MADDTGWYIIKPQVGQCQIVPAKQVTTLDAEERWGPYNSQGEAIARRVGLIRAGKCSPA